MKSEKLSRLFSAISNPANNQEIRKTNATEVAKTEKLSADAVNVKFSKEVEAQQLADSEQAAKVARIKEEVQCGKYQVDSKKVAAAFMQELGLV